MDLTIQDVTRYLQVPEDTIMSWVKEGVIPSYQLNNEYRFSREEIEEWVLRHHNQEDLEIDPKEPVLGSQQFNLFRALHKGVVISDVVGNTKAEVIRNSMQRISEKLDSLDPEMVSNLLLDREKLMSTAINRGVAVPHTRDFLLSEAHDVVAVVYPKKPIEYGALDGTKVHSLFFLFACKDERHLNLLSKIAYYCHQTDHLDLLKSKADKQALLNSIRHWEVEINQLQPA